MGLKVKTSKLNISDFKFSKMPKISRKRKEHEFFCGHCDEVLSKTTYWRHRRLYFNTIANEWNRSSLKVSNTLKGAPQKDLLIAEMSDDDYCFEDDNVSQEPVQTVNLQNGPLNHETLDMENESTSEKSCSESEDEEVWNDKEEDLLQDIDSESTPLPDPRGKHSKCKSMTSLLQWFAYFLLFWQASCMISDNGLEWLLRFMFQFLRLLGVTCSNEYIIEMTKMFPSSLYLLRQFVKLERDNFTKFVVCPDCTKLYELDNCTTRISGRVEAKRCCNKPFRSGRSKECGALLAKKVTTEHNKTVFYPFKIYCFNSIINQMESILKRPGMSDLCDQWRQRKISPGQMADIYDGQIWKDFQTVSGKDFLRIKNNIALAINVDWFQPYKRRRDRSVGVIYFVILNLPRELRYKWENVIVAGVIPELKKEPKSLNSFLKPIINELEGLWKGIKLRTRNSITPVRYRAAVILASSDIPASRKLCGFKGHAAHRGCSKCFKFFPGSFAEKTDYSGFNVDDWPKRSNRTHRIHAHKVKHAANKTQQEKLAKQYGVYYSSLLELEYFDAVRFTVVDPMHNLFLGTAKNVFKVWIAEDILTTKVMQQIEKRILDCDVPTGFGRLPNKIASNFGCYTASQWKNWTLIYSVYCLKGLIPEEHFKCWQLFVLACQYMSRHVISDIDIIRADGLFKKFCIVFESLYGKVKVTPNMHLHCHLKDCVLDYGPLHAFWCFSFERFNGILGATRTNGRSIEVQLMRKLNTSKFTWNFSLPEEFKETLMPFFNRNDCEIHSEFCDKNAMFFTKSSSYHDLQDITWNDLTLIVLPKTFVYLTLDEDDLNLLWQCYQVIIPNLHDDAVSHMSSIVRRYPYVLLGSEKFGSKKDSKSLRSSRVLANWAANNGEIDPASGIRPGQVNFYFLHSITINGKTHQFVFAAVSWFSYDEEADIYGNPTKVWKRKSFDTPGPAVFMPVQRISSTFAACPIVRNKVEKLVVIPIPRLYT